MARLEEMERARGRSAAQARREPGIGATETAQQVTCRGERDPGLRLVPPDPEHTAVPEQRLGLGQQARLPRARRSGHQDGSGPRRADGLRYRAQLVVASYPG